MTGASSLEVMSWCAFYADRPPFSSEDGKPAEAPEGIQAIAERRDGRTMVHSGGNFYRWDGGWRAVPTLPDIKESGPEMEDEAYKDLRAEAMEWLHGLVF